MPRIRTSRVYKVSIFNGWRYSITGALGQFVASAPYQAELQRFNDGKCRQHAFIGDMGVVESGYTLRTISQAAEDPYWGLCQHEGARFFRAFAAKASRELGA